MMAGFIKSTRLIYFANERFGKTKQHIINHGEALAILLIVIASGEYKYLIGLQDMPLSNLLHLSKKCSLEHLTCKVFADALTTLFKYGHEQFS